MQEAEWLEQRQNTHADVIYKAVGPRQGELRPYTCTCTQVTQRIKLLINVYCAHLRVHVSIRMALHIRLRL